jgi:hypothetical protein
MIGPQFSHGKIKTQFSSHALANRSGTKFGVIQIAACQTQKKSDRKAEIK